MLFVIFFIVFKKNYFFATSSFLINPLLFSSVLTAVIISSIAYANTLLVLLGFKVEVVPDQSNLLDSTS